MHATRPPPTPTRGFDCCSPPSPPIPSIVGLPLPADWDGYPLPMHRLTPPGAPGLDPRPWQWEPSAAATASGYFREA